MYQKHMLPTHMKYILNDINPTNKELMKYMSFENVCI